MAYRLWLSFWRVPAKTWRSASVRPTELARCPNLCHHLPWSFATSGSLVSGVNLTRFSDAFGIFATNDDDWFDLTIEVDSNFGVDPFLIYQDDSSRWNTAHDHILEFFAVVFDCIRRAPAEIRTHSTGRPQSNCCCFVNRQSSALASQRKAPFGAGSGEGLQKEVVLESISVALDHGKNSIPHMEYIDVLAGGLGLDRIGDMTCNILKSYFIKYTQDVCRRHEIPMTKVLVHNTDWSADDYEWVSKWVELPINPAYAKLSGCF